MTPVALTLVLPTLMLLISSFNTLSLRRPSDESEPFNGSVAVLLPVRNEEENVLELVSSLKKQMGIARVSFHFLDDNSSDATFTLITQATKSDKRFSITHGDELATGWLGKPYALQQALEKSSSDVVVVIDADVRLEAHALVSAIGLMKSRHLSFVSAYPRQIALSLSERLIQPLLQWSWLSTVPLAISERSLNPAFAVANGQFFIAKRSALEDIHGFSAVKEEIIDDIALARALLRAGHRGTVIDGSRIASCRMYKSWPELREGYSKSLRVAFGGVFGSFIAALFLFGVGVAPLSLGLFGYALIVGPRIVSASLTKGRIWDALLHPLSIILLVYLLGRSWVMRGRTQWKGRVV